jgi:hypothetical protein
MVQPRVGGRATCRGAGQHEGRERRQRPVHRVHRFFERRDVPGTGQRHALPGLAARGREHASGVEQPVLNPTQARVQRTAIRRGDFPISGHGGATESDNRVQFIHAAVRLDPGMILGDARAADQAGFPVITGARIDAIDANCHARPR